MNKSTNDEDGWTGLTGTRRASSTATTRSPASTAKHNFQVGFLYQLPWQSENGQATSPRRSSTTGRSTARSPPSAARPFNVSANGNTLNTPSNPQTADQVGDVVHVRRGRCQSGVYYDRAAWAQPTGVRFGNSGRNAFRGPGGVNVDFSLFRGFSLGGTRRLEFRAEAFNLTNTPKFGQPNGDITSPNFMQITGVLNGYSERQVRLGLRFAF